ncbi:uncharacterized protein MXMO3_03459 (plasmid) [Maritalea myrionectae]|uniref:DNA primase TraC n=1 Tax=Maritalea myrionectae TaxID=454601 RepID=A0A2R4MIX6_9HYPH|nr:zincin-like metallopeptidase domain-containing protein [Maritalea myrionectae]AVX05962.1 uncharacterized protein MXMO3_03459 [Maritalea myrionectae]
MSKSEIYNDITNAIVAHLESINLDDYEAPFGSLCEFGLPHNPTTESNYSGVNIVNLWVSQFSKGYSSARWATFNQWKKLGGKVRKGEKSTPIIFYKTRLIKDTNEQGEEDEKSIPMLKMHRVFNLDQIEGIELESQSAKELTNLVDRIALADEFCKNTGAKIIENGRKAFYQPSTDSITMPAPELFNDTKTATATENFYSVLFHELTHWSGGKSRLNRDLKGLKQNKSAYAFEELIAELGAAFLCPKFNIGQFARKDHAQYIASWLKVMKDDPKFVFKASAAANNAVAYLEGLQSDMSEAA